MKRLFRFEFHLSLFSRVQLTIRSIGPVNGLAPNWHQTITRTNADPVPRHIYAALGWEEFSLASDSMCGHPIIIHLPNFRPLKYVRAVRMHGIVKLGPSSSCGTPYCRIVVHSHHHSSWNIVNHRRASSVPGLRLVVGAADRAWLMSRTTALITKA